jgi:hypothetical protein
VARAHARSATAALARAELDASVTERMLALVDGLVSRSR